MIKQTSIQMSKNEGKIFEEISFYSWTLKVSKNQGGILSWIIFRKNGLINSRKETFLQVNHAFRYRHLREKRYEVD